MIECENDLQEIFGIIENWSKKWRLEIDLTKTNIIHIRKGRQHQPKLTFLYCIKQVFYCQYYISCINGYIDFKFTVEKDADSYGGALGAIISKLTKTVVFHLKFINCCNNYQVSSIKITSILLQLSGYK